MDFEAPKDEASSSLLETDLQSMREYYSSGITKEASWRKSQLKALLSLLQDNQELIFEALKQDLGKHHAEAYRDEVYIYINK